MPTLDEWQQALTAPRIVTVESSPELVQELRRLHEWNDQKRTNEGKDITPRKDNLVEVRSFAPEREIEIIPAYLLQRLGVVTTPVVENLADICSSWAYLRYLWAFEMPNPLNPQNRLRLSKEALEIDFHQKALLSDQIGVGVAAVLMGTYFDAPLAVDVSIALGNPLWGLGQQNKSSPDYLFFDATQQNLFVVECKGTQSSRSESLNQLRRGSEQVQSLIFNDRPAPSSFVIATCLTRRGAHVLVVDPPGEDEKKRRAERMDERSWRISDSSGFSRSSRLFSQAKILAFSGDDALAQRKVEAAEPSIRTQRRAARRPELVASEFGDLLGVRQPIGVADRMRVEVFQGVARDLHEALIQDDYDRVDAVTREFQQRASHFARLGLNQPIAVSRRGDTLTVQVAGPDGTALEIRVAAP